LSLVELCLRLCSMGLGRCRFCWGDYDRSLGDVRRIWMRWRALFESIGWEVMADRVFSDEIVVVWAMV
jgi:hypothetical protein